MQREGNGQRPQEFPQMPAYRGYCYAQSIKCRFREILILPFISISGILSSGMNNCHVCTDNTDAFCYVCDRPLCDDDAVQLREGASRLVAVNVCLGKCLDEYVAKYHTDFVVVAMPRSEDVAMEAVLDLTPVAEAIRAQGETLRRGLYCAAGRRAMSEWRMI